MVKRVMEEKDRVNKERRITMRIKNVIVILLKIRIFSRNSEKHKSHIIIFRLVLVLSFTPQKVLTLTK